MEPVITNSTTAHHLDSNHNKVLIIGAGMRLRTSSQLSLLSTSIALADMR